MGAGQSGMIRGQAGKGYGAEGRMDRKRILVAGRNSYIGSSFVRYAEEHYGEALLADTAGMRDGGWRMKDLSNYEAVLYAAGIAHADVEHVTEEQKREYYRVNTGLALEVARRAKEAGVGQFVFLSSMIVYGSREYVTRETVPKPENFYGDSKWQADQGVRELADGEFRVAVLRLPLVYGYGSKGNYPVLSGLARKLPVFPKVRNRRSMLYIENLCEFLCCLVQDGRGGIFFPQDREWVCTGSLVKEIAGCWGHPIWVTPLLAPFAAAGKHFPGKVGKLCRKAFGSSCYDLEMSEAEWNYRVADWKESVRRTESVRKSGG